MNRSFCYSLFVAVCFPLLLRAQDVYSSTDATVVDTPPEDSLNSSPPASQPLSQEAILNDYNRKKDDEEEWARANDDVKTTTTTTTTTTTRFSNPSTRTTTPSTFLSSSQTQFITSRNTSSTSSPVQSRSTSLRPTPSTTLNSLATTLASVSTIAIAPSSTASTQSQSASSTKRNDDSQTKTSIPSASRSSLLSGLTASTPSRSTSSETSIGDRSASTTAVPTAPSPYQPQFTGSTKNDDNDISASTTSSVPISRSYSPYQHNQSQPAPFPSVNSTTALVSPTASVNGSQPTPFGQINSTTVLAVSTASVVESQPAPFPQINSTTASVGPTAPIYASQPTQSTRGAFSILPYYPANVSSSINSSGSPPLVSVYSSGTAPTAPIAYATSYPSSAALHLPKPIYSNYTWPNVTHPSNSSYIPLNETCTLSNPTCPACNNKTVTDPHNVTYTIQCDFSLDATLDYAFAEPLTAEYCLSRCDQRNVTCLGASWSTEECVLALGPIVGKIKDPGHLAFLRLAVPQSPNASYPTNTLPRPPVSTGLSYLNMTRYDGGSLTRVPRPTSPAIEASLDTDSSSATQTETDSAIPTPSLISYDAVTVTGGTTGGIATAANPFATTDSSTSDLPSTPPFATGRPPWVGPGYHGPPRPPGPPVPPTSPETPQGERNWPWWLQWGWWKKAWGSHDRENKD
ncbi:hypothetical protein Q7P37_005163 [Cladosporium fusiforme]